MNRKNRLIFLLLAFFLLVIIGRCVNESFSFLLNQFWFTSGFFLLLLLSLIDQPHFSKDSNIFVNGTTAWVSLLLVNTVDRNGIWWIFFIWASYLIISSYLLMWFRSNELLNEKPIVQITSRINRQIGRPEALFSAFFLWGCILQFGKDSNKLSPLFLFWAIFMILNLPALSAIINKLISSKNQDQNQKAGILLNIVSPRIGEVSLSPALSTDIVGHDVVLIKNDRILASGVLIDDRIASGQRIGRIAISKFEEEWANISIPGENEVALELATSSSDVNNDKPISVVDVGTEIDKIVFFIHPNQILESGDVLWVVINSKRKAFYQVISASVCQMALFEGNQKQSVRVIAEQLGVWVDKYYRFEPITWLAPAGQLIYKTSYSEKKSISLPKMHEEVGNVPNSNFPVHVNIDDIVTHNSSIIGVTGSGKSFLAFHLIEAMIKNKIKVLILDISRQHDIYLKELNPTALKRNTEVKAWWESDSLIGIHQYANAEKGYPATTADFVLAAFEELSKMKLERGKNSPARLCVVFEEAHSLIPEWNQVAQHTDVQQVNKTARTILQGRKYGMGALIITQRTANVTKTILNQCNTIFAFQSFDQTGLDFLKNYMGEEYSHAISTLPIRHAILVGKASSSTRPVLFAITDMAERWKEIKDEAPNDPAVDKSIKTQ